MRKKLTISMFGFAAIAIVAAALVVAKHNRKQQCYERQKAIDARKAQLDALAKKVPIGASKQEIEDFYKRNNMKFYFESIEGKKDARGRVEMKSCSQHQGCGDDIGVVVEFKLDDDWRLRSSTTSIAWLNCVDFTVAPPS